MLSRLRLVSGLHIERQQNLVVVRDPIWCDVEEFIRIATNALATVDDVAVRNRLALSAQELWRGAPLEM